MANDTAHNADTPHNASPPQKTILLGITGGIAAYKVCDLARRLARAGHYRVKTIMTPHATELIGPATFRALTGNPVATDLFDQPGAPIHHISLAEEADVFLIAPATANLIAKLAHGQADDLLTTTALAYQGPLLLAPAMNTQMYLDPTTQENLATLAACGVTLIGPATGDLACGDTGPGRMVEAAELFEALEECVQTSTTLAGKHILISAGPTQEHFDPVRYLTNRSSGKMGYALARAALNKGAEQVTLVTGPTGTPAPVDKRLTRVDVISTAEMRTAMLQAAPAADLILCAAAVADYRPSQKSLTKVKKYALSSSVLNPNEEDRITIEFTMNPDILAELGQMKAAGDLKPDTILVGFAAETDNLDKHTRAKLESKGADYIVANDVSRPDIGFEANDNEARVLSATGLDALLPLTSKTRLAHQIFDLVTTGKHPL